MNLLMTARSTTRRSRRRARLDLTAVHRFTPIERVGGVVALVLSVGGTYIYDGHDDRAIEIAAQAKAEAVATRIATKTAEQFAAIEIKHITVKQRVETEIRREPVYSACRNTAVSM
jgi:uncharacterized membrane protein YbhN (UPF0104 family)